MKPRIYGAGQRHSQALNLRIGHDGHRSRISAMRLDARPSPNGGVLPDLLCPARMRAVSTSSRSMFFPINVLVPNSTVTDRSVFSLKVRQGAPRNVVSSWIPPESVITSAAWRCLHEIGTDTHHMDQQLHFNSPDSVMASID